MGKGIKKTNVMRILDAAHISYEAHLIENAEGLSGAEMAQKLGEDPRRVFKTLVTVGASKEHYVFVIPVEEELDLKKAARAAGEKNIAMVKSKELLPLTGYVHGGCSPIGMKKAFRTFFHETAEQFEKIYFSAGKIGHQVELSPADLDGVVQYTPADLTCE